ncbi:MAG: hypothetical protein CL624_05760 [Arcobacter sp.]|nr:hypothetical protein [Arcobacter sp.]
MSILTYSINTLPSLDEGTRRIVNYLEYFFITVFTIEYTLRVYTAPNKFKYIFSFYGIIDLLSIIPFYCSLFFDGEFLKVLRLLIIFRHLI